MESTLGHIWAHYGGVCGVHCCMAILSTVVTWWCWSENHWGVQNFCWLCSGKVLGWTCFEVFRAGRVLFFGYLLLSHWSNLSLQKLLIFQRHFLVLLLFLWDASVSPSCSGSILLWYVLVLFSHMVEISPISAVWRILFLLYPVNMVDLGWLLMLFW